MIAEIISDVDRSIQRDKPKCSVCGNQDLIRFNDDPALTFCPACCGKSEISHNFKYERSERAFICQICGIGRENVEL